MGIFPPSKDTKGGFLWKQEKESLSLAIGSLPWIHCTRLGLIFEAKVGKGKLLICTAQLDKCDYDPAAHKLHECLLEYAASDKFAPRDELAIEAIQSFFE